MDGQFDVANALLLFEDEVQLSPDVLIAAVGAEPIIPDIPGVKNKNVIIAASAYDEDAVGRKVVIIGGGLAGLRAAIEASRNGSKTIVVSKSSIGGGTNTGLAGGGFSMANDKFSIEEHISKTLNAGKNLNDIRGVLYAKEFLTSLAKTGQVDIRKIIRSPSSSRKR
jgi:NADPH-dependent 2,4-dienoyl-CoA reductase/sulfur reductase-like enzyme